MNRAAGRRDTAGGSGAEARHADQTNRTSGAFSSLPEPSVVSATTNPWRR